MLDDRPQFSKLLQIRLCASIKAEKKAIPYQKTSYLILQKLHKEKEARKS